MKKIDWKARFKNKLWVSSLISAILVLIQVVGIVQLPEDIEVKVNILLSALVGLGILIDPSTPGLTDK